MEYRDDIIDLIMCGYDVAEVSGILSERHHAVILKTEVKSVVLRELKRMTDERSSLEESLSVALAKLVRKHSANQKTGGDE